MQCHSPPRTTGVNNVHGLKLEVNLIAIATHAGRADGQVRELYDLHISCLMTLIGAAMLLLISIAIGIVGGKAKEAELQRLMIAHNVAELLINEKKYPPFLMGKSITVTEDKNFEQLRQQDEPEEEDIAPKASKLSSSYLDQFHIQGLILVNHENGQQIVLSRDEAREFFKNAGDSV